ncbi:MAG: hypothetical protein KBB75_00030 [Candidatus Pacebacteria bacterium]|jgi:hypothetical protein|nr:hypothetical protein [Candidatus Paceibacterota bacterium]
MNKIILNNELYQVKEKDLPFLIIYGEKSGGSHFTITLVVDLFLSGSKILFFTAFPMAKDNFLEQIGSDHSKVVFINSVEDIKNYKDNQVLILESGNENLFIEAISILQDLNERVVLVKNIEAFSQDIFNNCLDLKNVVLSGNIDICIAKEQILKKSFKSIVVFTKPEISLPIEVPILEKWTGYLSGQDNMGVIKVHMV